ncbi:MAG: cadmium-translocating P-type ATPase [Alphaproteobacteria bacterium]|nr:cadmium-translocating P-type ATPase [Alphaproteobacteria bacterium]
MTDACRHCGEPLGGKPLGAGREDGFCCAGCAAAFATVNALGLAQWYERRTLPTGARPLRPQDDRPVRDTAIYETAGANGTRLLHLMVDGLQCAACVWLIENVLARQPGVVEARVNMSTRRLRLRWKPETTTGPHLIEAIQRLGYRLTPFDQRRAAEAMGSEDRALLKAMAVAGFAAGNVMLLSVSVWAGHTSMGDATRDLFHWVSALIALPAIAYAGRPFFRSALSALHAGRLNMDVPISLGVLLAAGMSLVATVAGRPHAYFDAAVTLLFFLLVGRFLDRRARARARSVAENLLAVNAQAITVVAPDGARSVVPPDQVRPGQRVAVAAGERIGVDGVIAAGRSDVDMALVTGESVPGAVGPGERVYCGTLNLTGPIEVTATAAGESTLVAEIVRLMENAEQARGRYRLLADRVSRAYAPAVHVLGLTTLAGWLLHGAGWETSLMNAIAVLIITCPCALALAVPAVQVVATGRLFRSGILVKSADALERLAGIDTVVFDKTGTLTEGRPILRNGADLPEAALRLAASLAVNSRHPLSRALAAAAPSVPAAPGVREVPGAGLELDGDQGTIRLGSRAFCGIQADDRSAFPELWLALPGRPSLRFEFEDAPRQDAAATIAALRGLGLEVRLLSGDRRAAVDDLADRLGIDRRLSGCSPVDKTRELAALAAAGRRTLMVGDGLNDAPALAAAAASMSPASAADISQTAADLVWQGRGLWAVVDAIRSARLAQRLARQNIALAIGYNLLAVPLAMAGQLTPLIAAVAMSTSSLAVSLNALRARRTHDRVAVPDTGRPAPRPAGALRAAVGA